MTRDPWSEVLLVAVDIGNTRTKFGGFRTKSLFNPLPLPDVLFELDTDSLLFEELGSRLPENELRWIVGSVHRSAGAAFVEWIAVERPHDTIERLTNQSIPMPIEVETPERVGIDRLLVCFAANQLRDKSHGAIVVTVGTAISVNVLTAGGAFVGGAILPGLHLAAKALGQGTDALPIVAQSLTREPPAPCGKNTEAAIAAGLYWGAVGAIRELIEQIGHGTVPPANLFFTGGDAESLADAVDPKASYRAELVLSGAALVANVM